MAEHVRLQLKASDVSDDWKEAGENTDSPSLPVRVIDGVQTDALTDAQLRASAVPVSVDSLPIPSGAATEAKQDATVAAIQNISIPAPVGGATDDNQEDEIGILLEILSSLKAIAAAKGILSDFRVTLIGGTTAVTGTLTGVTTLTNITQVGGIQANTLIPANQNLLATMANINNVAS